MPSCLYGSRGLALASGRGGTVTDTAGREYVDFFTAHGSALFGHCHPRLGAALSEAAARPWTIGMGFDNDFRALLMEKLGSLLPEGRVYLCNSGTEAIEAALKLVTLARPERRRILALRRAFHGRTSGALSLTFNPHYRRPFQSLLFNVEHHAPENLPGAVDETVAAVFIEPVQGEGGVYPLDPALGQEISASCQKAGALLVADEIQSGFGRCGAMLASSLTGLAADVVCLAKGVAGGLPVGVTVWKGSLGDFPQGSHGSTYGGNPLVCRVACEALALLTDEKLCERARLFGDSFRSRLEEVSSPAIKEVRGLGLLVGVQVEGRSAPVVRALQERGVLALPAGPNVVRFLPSFAAEPDHFERVAQTLQEVLSLGNAE
ncbi:MAG: aspartate aminotransferase family protein [Synergistaceae bacterium]|nr:aspartate aminotransferase family protein [Synergistaceae bacterium]